MNAEIRAPLRWSCSVALAGLLLAPLAGCAAKGAAGESPAAPAQEAPGASFDMSPATEEARDPAAELDEAERELDAALGSSGFAQPPTSPGPAPTPMGSDADACTTACRALSSMERAAEHLCELSEGDERCAGAQQRVARARERVTAQCPACS